MLQTAKIFQNGMLLQRGKEILIWGNSEPETVINVEIQGKRVSGKADKNGEWQVTIPSLKASEGETINITTDKENLRYEDVAVGEVWVAGCVMKNIKKRQLKKCLSRRFVFMTFRKSAMTDSLKNLTTAGRVFGERLQKKICNIFRR